MNFKGVIFDLDGTMIDSLEDIADSMNAVLHNNKLPLHNLVSYKQFIGKGLRNLVTRALPETLRTEEMRSRCLKQMMEEYNTNCIHKTKPYDGIKDLLDELVSRDIKLSVFSNKADDLTQKIVLNLFSGWKFEEIIGLKTESLKKPNPQVALLISKKTGIPTENMIYMGDTGIDMQTANNAGMYAVGVLWGFRNQEELETNGARYIIAHPLDLIQILPPER